MRNGSGASRMGGSAIVVLLSLLVVVVGPQANSFEKLPIVCHAGASMEITSSVHFVFFFTVRGAGSCTSGKPGQYELTFTGDGTECDEPLPSLCNYWGVDATLALRNIKSGVTKTLYQNWIGGEDILASHAFGILGGGVGAGYFHCKTAEDVLSGNCQGIDVKFAFLIP